MFDHGYALLVGVGAEQYARQGLPHLGVPLMVAVPQALAAVLRYAQNCDYPADQITVPTNATATRGGIHVMKIKKIMGSPLQRASYASAAAFFKPCACDVGI